MTRHDYMHGHDIVADPFKRAAMEPGRRHRRHDLPTATFLCEGTSAEFGDVASVRSTGGIVRPDYRAALRGGRRPMRWLFDYVAAGM